MSNFDCKNDIIYLIRHLNKLLQIDFDNRVGEVGLTGAQARILFFINRKTLIENDVVHQNDIEKEFQLAKSTVNGLISRLLKAEFIHKKNVNRYAVLEMSQKGIDAISKIKEGRIKTVNKLFTGYSEEEKNLTLEKLRILIENLEEDER